MHAIYFLETRKKENVSKRQNFEKKLKNVRNEK